MNVIGYEPLQEIDFDYLPEESTPTPQTPLDNKYTETIIGNKKVYSCLHPGCGKNFKFQSEITRHLIIHYSERPFTCSVPGCLKSFKRADALTNHVRTHKKLTPFFCTVAGCASKFTTKSALKYHLLRHSGEKLFRCDYPGCKKAFITAAELKQHTNAAFCHKRVKSVASEAGSSELSQNEQVQIFEGSSFDESRETSVYDASYFNNQPMKIFCSEGSLMKVPASLETIHQDSGYNEREKFENDDTAISDLSSASKRTDSTSNNPLVTLLGHVMQENRKLKNSLQEALDQLQVYKQKEQKKDVDLFFKSTPEVERRNEKPLYSSVLD